MRLEYGVRAEGGHVEPAVSRHAATRQIERAIAYGANPRNTYLVWREVSDWRPAPRPELAR